MSNEQQNSHERNDSLTMQGMTGLHGLLILLACLVVGVCVYLTKHYFDVHFSSNLTNEYSLCNLSQFWSCDKATSAKIAQIFNVPLSVFGLLFGTFLLVGSLFPNENWERTNKFVATINFVGCILLLLYSLVVLGGLCPACTIYYFLSAAIFWLFYKKGTVGMKPSASILAIYGVVTLLVGGIFAYNVSAKQQKNDLLAVELMKQYDGLKVVGDPAQESPAKIVMSTSKFSEAPLRLSIFSDFQCPFCKYFAEQLPKLMERYKNKINIQYYFYPLDQSCNPQMKQPMHTLACTAAFLATCLKDQFAKAHDDIFAAQDRLSSEWIQEYAQKNNVVSCMGDAATKKLVEEAIKAGDSVALTGTPTILVNGVKINVPPTNQLIMIFDELLKRSGK